MTSAVPPKGTGPLARREARLAWGLLLPTLSAVSLVVILPLLGVIEKPLAEPNTIEEDFDAHYVKKSGEATPAE